MSLKTWLLYKLTKGKVALVLNEQDFDILLGYALEALAHDALDGKTSRTYASKYLFPDIYDQVGQQKTRRKRMTPPIISAVVQLDDYNRKIDVLSRQK